MLCPRPVDIVDRAAALLRVKSTKLAFRSLSTPALYRPPLCRRVARLPWATRARASRNLALALRARRAAPVSSTRAARKPRSRRPCWHRRSRAAVRTSHRRPNVAARSPSRMPSLPRSRSGRFVNYGAAGAGVSIVDTPDASDTEDDAAPDDGLLHRRTLMRAPVGVPNRDHSSESPNRFLALNVPSPRHGPKRHDSSSAHLFHIKGLVADREGNYEHVRKSEDEVSKRCRWARLIAPAQAHQEQDRAPLLRASEPAA